MARMFLVLALISAAPLSAHELWIEPLEYQVGGDGMLRADLVNGERFEGNRLSFLPNRFERFELLTGAGPVPVENRIGNRPALDQPAPAEGLTVVVYESTPSTVVYAEFEKFLSFARHKDFADIEARHRAAGHPTENFAESYSRFSKALIAVGDGAGADRRVGLETEIVALANPYTDDLGGTLRVQVFYGDEVRADAQVELFERAPDGTVAVTLHRTDAEGVAALPVRPGHEYMADAVVLRAPAPELVETRGVVWETLWAELNFAVPPL